jgi:hypothetical protein
VDTMITSLPSILPRDARPTGGIILRVPASPR